MRTFTPNEYLDARREEWRDAEQRGDVRYDRWAIHVEDPMIRAYLMTRVVR